MLPSGGCQGALQGRRWWLAFDQRLQHRQVGGAWLVQAGQHRVHGPDATLWRDDQARPAFAGVRGAVRFCDGFERPHDGRPDRDDSPVRRARRIYQAGGLGWYAVELLVGWLVIFEAGDASVQEQGRYLDAAGYEVCEQLWRKRSSGGGHLGAARLRGVDRLVVARRPTLPDVPVADREPVPLQVFIQRLRQVEGRDPQPRAFSLGRARRIRGVERGCRSSREAQSLAGHRILEGLGGHIGRAAELHDPEVRRQPGREVKLQRRAIFTLHVERGVHRPAGVDHQHVTGFEEIPYVPERGVDHVVVAPVGDHQAYFVTLEPPGLRRCVCL